MHSTDVGSRLLFRGSAALLLVLAVSTCTDNTGPVPGREPLRAVVATAPGAPRILMGAGDIASCDVSKTGDEKTARLIDAAVAADPTTQVFTVGDHAYPDGAAQSFTECYEPTWGRHKARTHPTPGDHDYDPIEPTAQPYFDYFGAAAGTPGQGYYSYDLGQWHIIALNSSIARSANSPQMQWLRNDLSTPRTGVCTLAYWHHPLYSSVSGTTSTTYASVRPFWDTLYAYGVDLVLNGHRHGYERIAPLKPNGTPDAAGGIRTLIAGTGGGGGITYGTIYPHSEVRIGDVRGVLKLYLYDDNYAWKFVPIAGQTATDSGSAACHGPPASAPTSLRFDVQPRNTTAGAVMSPAVQVEIRDASGVRVTTATNNITMAIGTNPAGGTLSGTKTVAAVSGVATFSDLSIDRVGTGYRLAASSSGLTGATSGLFDIAAPPVPTALAFVVQPTNAGAGTAISPAVQVEVRDQFGARLTTATNTVGMAIGTNPGGGTLSGTTSVAAVNGVATFSDLSINQVGPGYTLAASSSGLTGATSSGFDITAAPSITHTLLTSGNEVTNLNTYTTSSIAPAANTLVTIAVLSHRATATISPTVTGGGMASWDLVASVDFDTLALPHRRLSIYRAMSATPGSGPITFKFTNQVSNLEWIVSQWSGVEPNGANDNGASAIVQTGSNRANAVNGLSVDLAPFGSTTNVALGAFGVNSQASSITPVSGFAEIDEQAANESTRGDLQTEWAANQRTIGASWTNLKAGALGIEIKAQPGP
ncbi:MAG TPA: metallophosphoesterase [Gemmatimonadales bacterium]|jgi:hypothetical protein|nr:metallophosphoesterase [Gemmatimonadales bacterium]